MAVMWWWLGAALVVALVVVGVAGWWRASHADARRDAPSDKGERREFWVAHADRLRGLPRFQRLVAQRLRWGRLTLVGLAVAAVGAGLLGARVVGVSNDDELMRNRDVMLCLDVSASMAPVDTSVVRSYQRISGKLDTDRLGLVAFDSSAVVLFPLTSDAGFVQAHLSDAATRVGDIDHEPIAGTRIAGLGSSLVGDGLASCTSRFDQLDQPRSRTIVLATDGLVSGQAVYSITQAADAARSKGIMVFVVAPDNDDADALQPCVRPHRRQVGSCSPFLPGGRPIPTRSPRRCRPSSAAPSGPPIRAARSIVPSSEPRWCASALPW
ncbi:VWA domain-containing protein [Propionibacterium freudenreichii]|uniref:VWA domain-containing protein n=1 Tax=Propionibacterium freudenreichii TaxID=1744 RepID=UPI000BC32CBD|nr:VWA domain-containing protein [Propionibacterium freudenreichii]MDK9295529.1 VWA domain-containing protein [Propionibacterium freudenreichii]MDK9360904.1 VWA domain-containing protein [Propionibacterium freudenreichii]MDK9639871.1 VWA domain-containing protein [Propionibacterium freudenreichii]MDK9660915.1 VWA domain-containing protein [Propionibacterium freudenreichii]WGU90147.1 VWA domain-containing protein [Propionibacterium freudenreichii]